MTYPIRTLTIRGFKSIRELKDFRLRTLNVLIGANGTGKSNFISFFRLLANIMDGKLQYYAAKAGGPDTFLYYGRKTTRSLEAELYFNNNGYLFSLEPTATNQFIFTSEQFYWDYINKKFPLGVGHTETLAESGALAKIASYVVPAIRSWVVYHFHDTSESSAVKQKHALNDNERLRPDGGNLAAYLYRLREKYPDHYRRIVETIRLVVPFFADFQLRPDPLDNKSIQLEWNEKGSDYPFLGHHLSDGSLRFICLATVLLQPNDLMPTTILIDEPELGLHPYAIELLSALIHQAGSTHQLVVSTQSVELLNHFSPDNVIVVDRAEGQSIFKRLSEEQLKSWLADYNLGELWKKNVFGGRPA